jgi:preprotein translocase subunit SecA
MFEELNLEIRDEVVRTLFHAEIEVEEGGEALGPPAAPVGPNGGGNGGLVYEHESLAGSQAIAAAGAGVTAGAIDAGGGSVMTQQRVTSDREKNVGRNDPCWCGSGKKFKRCHGA